MKTTPLGWAALLLTGIAAVAPANAQGPCGDPMRDNGIQSQRGLGGLALAADAAGNVFIAEIGATVVRRLSPDGALVTAAGNGSRGFSGDGGPAAAAGFAPITALAADPAGNLFVAETITPRIRKVSSTGNVSTVAGNGVLNFNGDDGPATAASLCGPLGLAVDSSGNLFIASGTGRFGDGLVPGDYRVRRVAPDGIISTFAGRGIPPRGMETPAPDGSSAIAGGIFPMLIAAGGPGNLFYYEGRGSVRKVAPSGILTTPIPGAGPALGIAVDRTGDIFTAQATAVFKVDPAGTTTKIAGSGLRGSSGDGGPAAAAQVDVITNRGGGSSITVDGRGNVYFAESDKRIRKITPEGVISTVGRIP